MRHGRSIVFAGLMLALSSILAPAQAGPSADDSRVAARQQINAQCFAAVSSPLKNSAGQLTAEVRQAFLDWMSATILSELRERNESVPADCVKEVREDVVLRDAMFAAVFPPDPSILQNYARLRADMGVGFTKKYRSLAIATAVAKRVKSVESSSQLGREYQSGFWCSESLQTISDPDEMQLVAAMVDFMKATRISASVLYQDAQKQRQLEMFLKSRNIKLSLIAETGTSVLFGERLKNAMVILGQRPASRSPNPDTETWLRHLISIYEGSPASVPQVKGKELSWPLFPLEHAPWPLLMSLCRSVPFDEADYVWEAFQGKHGPDRFHTYGPYREDAATMPDELKPSKWFWDAWPDRLIHGGRCVPLSKATVDFYSSLGVPSVWAGQPGHANLISFHSAHGLWKAEIEQAFNGGPDVTFAQWYFDEDPGTELRFRDLYYWAGAEYHLGLALAMNSGLPSYMDTRIAASIFSAMPPAERTVLGVELLQHALEANPFNPEIWYRLANETPDAMSGLAIAKASMKHEAGNEDYWRTVEESVIRYAICSHPMPENIDVLRKVYAFLNHASGTVHALAPDAARYNLALANKGDADALFQMGRRYRDGNGVQKSNERSKEFFTEAVAHGNAQAERSLQELNGFVPENLIKVTPSSQFGPQQTARHLVDHAGMHGDGHDNNATAYTMWHTVEKPATKAPAQGLPLSPAWVKFSFALPQKIDAIEIWNHNQARLTNRGFKETRIWGSTDDVTWLPLTAPETVQLPRAGGNPGLSPVTFTNVAPDKLFSSVIIAAAAEDGNYGGTCYGLSAVRFVIHHDGAEIETRVHTD